MKPRTALAVVAGLAVIMMAQSVVLTFWCESASIFSFRVEDLTYQSKHVFHIGEFKSTIPGTLDFVAVLILALLARRGRTVSLLGAEVTPRHQVAGIVFLTGWNVVFAAFLVILEFLYLTRCPV